MATGPLLFRGSDPAPTHYVGVKSVRTGGQFRDPVVAAVEFAKERGGRRIENNREIRCRSRQPEIVRDVSRSTRCARSGQARIVAPSALSTGCNVTLPLDMTKRISRPVYETFVEY